MVFASDRLAASMWNGERNTHLRTRFALVGGLAGAIVGAVWAYRAADKEGLGVVALPFGMAIASVGGGAIGVAVGLGVRFAFHPPRPRDRPLH